MLDYDKFHKLLRHEPDTGFLYWKPRPLHMFRTEKLYEDWNTTYAHCRALNSDDGDGYLRGRIFDKFYKAHRVMWIMETNTVPDIIDHIDGIKCNNVFDNLRNVSISENNKNLKRFKTNTSGISGVSFIRNKWRARIYVDGKEKHLGIFDKKEDAIFARVAAEKEYGYHENHGRH